MPFQNQKKKKIVKRKNYQKNVNFFDLFSKNDVFCLTDKYLMFSFFIIIIFNARNVMVFTLHFIIRSLRTKMINNISTLSSQYLTVETETIWKRKKNTRAQSLYFKRGSWVVQMACFCVFFWFNRSVFVKYYHQTKGESNLGALVPTSHWSI